MLPESLADDFDFQFFLAEAGQNLFQDFGDAEVIGLDDHREDLDLVLLHHLEKVLQTQFLFGQDVLALGSLLVDLAAFR